MKLILTNFLCWKDRTFTFTEEKGITLISGPSGAGKTTILRAILFALLGEGRKLYSYGTKKCQVELIFESHPLRIKRTKSPNRLVVNEIYEDQSGQAVIDEYLGEHFRLSGYLQQKGDNSFLSLSPSEKLEVLEKIALDTLDLSRVRSESRLMLTEWDKKLADLSTQLKMSREVLTGRKKPDPVSRPYPSGESILKSQKKDQKDRSLLDQQLTTTQSTLLHLHEEVHSLEKLSILRNEEKKRRARLTKELSEIEVQLSELNFQGEENLQELRADLEYLSGVREWKDLVERKTRLESEYQSLVEDEKQALETQLSRLADRESPEKELHQLQRERDRYHQRMKLLDELSHLSQDQPNLSKLEEELSQIRTRWTEVHHRLLTEGEVYTCPSCQTALSLIEGELQLVAEPRDKNELEREDKALHLRIRQLEKQEASVKANLLQQKRLDQQLSQLPSSPPDETKLAKLQAEVNEYRAIQERRRHLKEELSSLLARPGIRKLRQDLKETERKLTEFGEVELPDSDQSEEEIRHQLEKEEKIRPIYLHLTKQKKRVEDELKVRSPQQETERHRTRFQRERTTEEVKDEIVEKEILVGTLQEKIREITVRLEQVEKYNRYQKELKEHRKWRDRAASLEKEIEEARVKLLDLQEWKTLLQEAEALAVTSTIEVINSHLSCYLDLFFPDDPMTVQLKSFRETQKKVRKPQIDLEVSYKGMLCNLSDLSGGEYDRVSMALTLALTELFNTPLIMLDESISSLDAETSEQILGNLRRIPRMILVVAHQATSGLFTQVVNL